MHSLQVIDYMNRHPLVFNAAMSIEQAVDLLLQHKQTGGPVVDAQQRLVGFLSEQDCLAAMLRDTYHAEQSASVADCMYRGTVLSVTTSSSVIDLAQQMGNQRPKVYPVVDELGVLVGVITRADVLRAINFQLQDSYAAH
jgi:CBS-domain-containing membrane protein